MGTAFWPISMLMLHGADRPHGSWACPAVGRATLSILLLLVIQASSIPRCAQSDHSVDCAALLDLYNATGQQLAGWADGSSMCTWQGVSCDGTTGQVTELSLVGKLSGGTVPDSIGDLAGLQILELSSNNLGGTMPSSMDQLSALQYLYMNDNAFNGTLSSSIGNMTSLIVLDLKNNAFTGSLPASLGLCTTMKQM